MYCWSALTLSFWHASGKEKSWVRQGRAGRQQAAGHQRRAIAVAVAVGTLTENTRKLVVYARVCMNKCTRMCVCACVRAACVRACVRVCVRACVLCVRVCVRVWWGCMGVCVFMDEQVCGHVNACVWGGACRVACICLSE